MARTDNHDLAGAIADLTIALRLDPIDHQIWNNRALAYSQRGQYHQALADLNEALRLKPQNILALANRGMCWIQFGDYEKAQIDYELTAKLQPTSPKWKMICAALKARLGDTAAARKDREAAPFSSTRA